MARIDVQKVKGKMAERGYTKTSLSKKLGINRNTLVSYLKSPEKTPYNVVAAMAEILCDSPEEACAIFFAHDLRKT